MQVLLLGPFEVRDADARIELRGARLRTLLARLAIDAGRVVSVDALALALWSDDVPADQTNAVQTLVSRLRRALPDPTLLESRSGGYRLVLAADDVDVLRFRTLAQRARAASQSGDPVTAASVRDEALSLWRGPAFADLRDAAFAASAATALDNERRGLQQDRVSAALESGRAAEVLPELEAWVAADPIDEPAVALLMTALYDLGRPAQALRCYADLRTTLAETLGTDPSAPVQALHEQLLRRDRTPPTAPVSSARSRLPAALTSFLGRDQELVRLDGLLRSERLVTLVGPGGAGKTRLAIEAAAALDPERVEVTVVELAPVTDPADITQATLDALDLRAQRILETSRYPRPDPRTRVLDGLDGAPHLLLLDNCEHLIEGAAAFAADLLAHSPRLRVLATSREPLAITGEVVFPVPTLACPAPAATVEDAGQAAAVRLFLDRARAASPAFGLDEQNVRTVIELCRRLDGLPLAIELAAARLRTMTVDQLAARLDDRFRLLTGGSRTAVARHRTLRAVVEWSWDLLDTQERTLAERFSVFSGEATVDAVQAVCLDPGSSLADAEDALARLADRSLLQLVRDAASPRYRMLETLREYGAERLAADRPSVQRKHARYFRDLAESIEPTLRTGQQLAGIGSLEAERDNLLAALRFSADAEDADTAMRICAALGWFWLISDSHAEAATWCRTAIDVPGTTDPETTALVVGLYLVNALAAEVIAMTDRATIEAKFALIPEVDPTTCHPLLALLGPAESFLRERIGDWAAAIDAALQHPDPWAKGALHLLRAQVHENAGAAAAHREDITVALAYFRVTGDRWGIATCLHGIGDAKLLTDELADARAAYEEALAVFSELGVWTSDEVQLLMRLATVAERTGRPDQAEALIERAGVVAARSGSRAGAVMVDIAKAMRCLREGDLPGARAALQSVDTLLEGGRGGGVAPQLRAVQRTTQLLVGVAEQQDPAQLQELLREAIGFARTYSDMPVTALVAEGAASWASSRGDGAEAARLLGAAAAMRGIGSIAADRGGLNQTDPVVAIVTERAVGQIGEKAFTRIFREQALSTIESACSYVFGLAGESTGGAAGDEGETELE